MRALREGVSVTLAACVIRYCNGYTEGREHVAICEVLREELTHILTDSGEHCDAAGALRHT